jgi:hypothetical protein
MLGLEKRLKAMYGDVRATQDDVVAGDLPAGERKVEAVGDLSKVALALGALAVLLVIGFFVGIDMKLGEVRRDVAAQIDTLAPLQTNVTAASARLDGIERRVGAIEAQPLAAKRLILESYVQDMVQRANLLGAQVESPAQKARLDQVRELLGQIQTDIAK